MGSDPQPCVYIKSAEYGWLPGKQLSNDGKTATVAVPKKVDEETLLAWNQASGTAVEEVTVKLKDYKDGVLPMQNVNDSGTLGNHEDMVNLPYLHEAAILYNIKNRHSKALPYTRTGDMVVAVNPYQWIDSLYTEEKRKLYAQKLVWEIAEQDLRDQMAPHVYEVSALSYKNMAFEGGMDQSILVSGESGAGKTETVKICLNHIASVQEGPGASSSPSLVVQRILESNPVLEAFGNAKTRRNDNSSRFGKYLQLQFSGAGGRGRPVAKLSGSKSDVFLLEKNRVCAHDSAERTYHIFYQIVAASDSAKADIWSGLKGTNNDSFKYVGHTDTNKIEGVTDGDQFTKTVDTLKMVGVSSDMLNTLLQALCIVLQLGNVTFGPKGGDADKCEITSGGELKALAGLMGIPEPDLTLALTERTIKTRDETLKVPLKPDDAKEGTDALAKETYGKIFNWVVKSINAGTTAEEKGKKFRIIGLLDIFGFESFPENRFEQLCINYANEKLQQKFTEDIFKAVMEEYKYEGIPLSDITYDDNTDVLDLIESRTGLCALLNEECVRPKGSGESFVNKALSANKKSPALEPNKTDRTSFTIVHYAGRVTYAAINFVEANKDTLPTDLEDCATKCTNDIISGAFMLDKMPGGGGGDGKKKPGRQKSNIMAPTVWTKYKGQLSSLMTSLYATQSRYIRCIKPNTVKKPLIMQHATTVEQLRCAGIVAAVVISRSAFPNRLSNAVVYARYNNMWDRAKYPSAGAGKSVAEKTKADCEAVLTCALKEKETKGKDGQVVKAFVVGKTRTYFRAGALEYLESQRVTSQDSVAIPIQKVVRGWLCRTRLGIKPKASKEAEEAARRAEEERLAALEAEMEAIRKKAKEEINNLNKEEKKLAKDSEFEDEKHSRALEEFEASTAALQAERDDLEKRCKEVENGVVSTKTEQDRLQAKLDANLGLVGTLKKENKKLHKSLEKLQTQYDSLSKNNKKLTAALDSDTDAAGELEYVQTVNERALNDRELALEEHAHLKDAVANEQMKYMAVAESRLDLQRTLAQILTVIQDKCTDGQLMQDVQAIAHACEAEAKSTMDAVETQYGV